MKTDTYDAYLHCYTTARTGRHVDVAEDADTAHRVTAALAVNDAVCGSRPHTRAEFAVWFADMLATAAH